MVSVLEEFDRSLFLSLNGFHSSWMDVIMSLVSNKFFWIPLYVFFAFLAFRFFQRDFFKFLILAVALVAFTDQSANLLKNNLVKRYRPCKNLEIRHLVHVNGNCGGDYGFVSGHSANSFGLAAFLFLTLFKRKRGVGVFLFFWAFLVGYSRIYNGVHYPADILGGAILGMVGALLVYSIYKIWIIKKV